MIKILTLKILYDEKLHSTKSIADKLEISRSTVKAVISFLRDTGIEIETVKGKYGGYMLLNKNKLW